MYKCDFNDYVECEKKKCSTCGWNPEVAKARMEEILAKRKEEAKKE